MWIFKCYVYSNKIFVLSLKRLAEYYVSDYRFAGKLIELSYYA